MSTRSTAHGTFTLDHAYDAAPADVFAAWASSDAKLAWWGPPDEFALQYELDFRNGGSESASMSEPSGVRWDYNAQYYDIIPNERIVFSYQMARNDQHASASVATVELTPQGKGTKLTLTECGVFLDGVDEVEMRKHGTGELLKSLAKALDSRNAPAV